MRRWTWMTLLALPLAAAACDHGSATDPTKDGVPESQLTFASFAPEVDSLLPVSGSVWAVAGQERTLELRYKPGLGQGGSQGEPILSLEIPAEGLLHRPDGTAFAPGDSVEITVSIDPTTRMVFRFEPTGLTFSPAHPAELSVSYRHVKQDINGDGKQDAEDQHLLDALTLWRQEQPGQRWFPIGTVKASDIEELEASITGFTGFAVAS